MKYNSVIFDLDGTLLNTIPDIVPVVNSVISRIGLQEKSPEEVQAGIGYGVEHLLKTLGVPEQLIAAASLETGRGFASIQNSKAFIYPGVADMLQRISAEGVRMFVLSNKLQIGVDKSVSDHLKFAGFRASRGSLPGKPAKPSPDVLHEMLAEFSVSPENTLFVGDGEPDIMTSGAAGIVCMSVLWGFRTKVQLEAFGAELFAETPDDVVRFVLQQEQ